MYLFFFFLKSIVQAVDLVADLLDSTPRWCCPQLSDVQKGQATEIYQGTSELQ